MATKNVFRTNYLTIFFELFPSKFIVDAINLEGFLFFYQDFLKNNTFSDNSYDKI